MDGIETFNADYIDEQYRRWKTAPESVSRDWQSFFKGFEIAIERPSDSVGVGGVDQMLKQSRVEALKHRYRDLGHLLACMDPLAACPTEHPLLSLESFGLSYDDLEQEFFILQTDGEGKAPLKEIIKNLRETYCRSIGVEYMHLQDPEERRWLQERMEPNQNRISLETEEKRDILDKLAQSALFEQFLNRKYVGVTRFSLEGGDAVIPLLETVTSGAADHGVGEVILGMAHRGRLNVQAHILQKTYYDIFAEFENCYDPDNLVGAGDVKYHNGYLTDILTRKGRPLRIYLVNNPSHLEAVDPVVEGVAKARQDIMGDHDGRKVLPLLIHGDAAFAGQGVVMETLNMSQLDGYRTGGTIHLIINNQIGYTTLPEDARSTRYSTDVAKMIMAPIFHVHGENPEAVVHVGRLATDYRMTFKKDVVIDLVCYRRYGHNEGDEPYFTQPLMYERIRERPSLNRIYADRLLEEGAVTKEQLDDIEKSIHNRLEADFEEVHGSACPFPEDRFYENWEGYSGRYSHTPLKTGVAKNKLIELSRKLQQYPPDFHPFSKLKGQLSRRLEAVEKGEGIDWANAEALAFASLLVEGTPIRLSGQDSARGTFSQRHSVLVDTKTGERYAPLDHLEDGQAPYRVYNSPLAEASVLGFDYGYSLARPDGLTIWEAQFGDFVNNAQAVVDLFIVSGEAKWQRLSGLVLLLPHGMEGLGPEHSSARLERFLQLCAADNIQVCNPTTPAQYFHLLRRQVNRSLRKPLVVMTPKSLLRHPLAVSTLKDLSTGAFEEILDDDAGNRKATRVILCSGKLYYGLLQRRLDIKSRDTAIVRIEQLYPVPGKQLTSVANRYKQVKEWCWAQEEPENMGAWQFLRPHLEKIIGQCPTYVGRPEAASPATGFPAVYKRQQEAVLEKALGSDPNGQVS